VTTVWDSVFAARPWGRWPAEEIVRAVARLRRAGLDVLELGCGPGAQLWYLEHEGHHATGLDLSREGLRLARTRMDEEGHPSRLVCGDLRAIPLASASFDLVIDVEALSCLPHTDVPAAWREAARVLRTGGSFVTLAFTPRTHGAPESGLTVSNVADGPLAGLGTISFLTADDAARQAAAAGLDPVDSQLRSRTVGPDQHLVEELVFTARKVG
jgi:SAM-dependent methyltransferase